MQPVLRRIAIHGGLTALALALIGLMLANMAGMWMAASQSPRATIRHGQNDASMLGKRVPLTMALWGFGFVAVGELVLYRFRRNRKPAPPPAPAPDPAEMLLEELLAQAEANAPSPPQNGQQPPSSQSTKQVESADTKTAAPRSP